MQALLTRFHTAARSLAVGVAACALFTQAASAAPTALLDGGFTSVTLSPQLVGAATALKLTLSEVRPALIFNGTAFFPIREGAIDVANAKGEIIHAGGLSIRNTTTAVTLTNFIIDTTGAQPILTGLVTANGSVVGRLPLFNLGLPALNLPLNVNSDVVIRNVNVTLTDQAAAALNGVFKVTAFAKGLPIGTAVVQEQQGFPQPVFFPPFPGFPTFH